MADEVLYEEADGIAIVAINRPGKKNTLTENVVRGIADGVDAATRSKEVAAVVLRGVGDTFTAGYDLTDGGEWDVPYGAPDVETREGAWDPVRDLAFMGSNVKRFMRIRECPKPVLGEIRGWAIGGATDLALCCDQLYMASDAHIGYAPSRIYGTPTTMLWVYRLGLEHAKQFLLTGRAIDARTAYRIGLVAHVSPPDELAGLVEADARRFRHIPANQLALNKLLINHPSRTWDCAPHSSSAPCSTASPATRKRHADGPNRSRRRAFARPSGSAMRPGGTMARGGGIDGLSRAESFPIRR